MERRTFLTLTAIANLAIPAWRLRAQESFPNRPLKVVVPLAPGGPTDQLARAVTQDLATDLRQPVIVENRPGADGAIAMREVASSPPDGHTLLFAPASLLATSMLAPSPGLDWQTTFAPLGRVGRLTFCMIVSGQVPVRTLAEFLVYARTQPNGITYATSTNSEFMAAAQFMQATGLRMTRVPYKGSAQALPDIVAGRVQVLFGPAFLAIAQQSSGGLRILATLLPQRSPILPDVPTMAESGFPSVSVPTWQALFVPAATPRPSIDRLVTSINRTLDRPEVRANLERRAVYVERADPQELALTVKQDLVSWRRLIDEHQLSAN